MKLVGRGLKERLSAIRSRLERVELAEYCFTGNGQLINKECYVKTFIPEPII